MASHLRANILIRDARPSDAFLLAPRLRAMDLLEIQLFVGRPAVEALIAPLIIDRLRTNKTVEIDGSVAAMFGVVHVFDVPSGRVGAPWFVSSDRLMREAWRQFARDSRRWIREMSKGYVALENYAYANNHLHIQWIQRAGFQLVELLPNFGVGEAPFWRFRMRFDGQGPSGQPIAATATLG